MARVDESIAGERTLQEFEEPRLDVPGGRTCQGHALPGRDPSLPVKVGV